MLSSSTIKRLADDGPGLRVSLYLPTHRAGSETAQDPIRLKNLLTRAAAELEEVGARSTEIDAMLKPRVLSKLGVRDRVQAVVAACEGGMASETS